MTRLRRRTGETEVEIAVRREGGGVARVRTGERFLDHMLETLARYADLELEVEAEGDLRHHLVEDVALTLGRALRREVPERAARYGWASVPMDDALVSASLDVGGRPWYEGALPSPLYTHFLRSLAGELRATLHVEVRRGEDRHHVVEAAVKAVGLALRQALRDGGSVFSTKGSVELEWLGEEPPSGGAGSITKDPPTEEVASGGEDPPTDPASPRGEASC